MFDNIYVRLGTGLFIENVPLTPLLLSSIYATPRALQSDTLSSLDAEAFTDSPWSESLAVARNETLLALQDMLTRVMLATRDLEPSSISEENLAQGSRAAKHLSGLKTLWIKHPQVMPADLRVLRVVLKASAEDALQPMSILHDTELTKQLSPAEQSVVYALIERHGAAAQDDPLVDSVVRAQTTPRAKIETNLGAVQRALLDKLGQALPQDGSLVGLTVRDTLQEAEITAGIIQSLLAKDQDLKPSDIAVLIPEASHYGTHLKDALTLAGLVASGLPEQASIRDLGAELLQLFVLSRRKPCAAMTLASIVASPLTPWDHTLGSALASQIIQGRVVREGKDKTSYMDARAQRLWKTIREPSVTTYSDIIRDLELLLDSLTESEIWADAVVRARGQTKAYIGLLRANAPQSSLDWSQVMRLLPDPARAIETPTTRYLNAVTVLKAGEMPRRSFKHMIVMGFNEGSYPSVPSANPFFLDSEIEEINARCNIRLDSLSTLLKSRLEIFRRQISQVSTSLIILASTRDRQGTPLAPSSSLPLLTRFIEGLKEAEHFFIDLNTSAAEAWPWFVARAQLAREPIGEALEHQATLQLGKDLLELRRDSKGHLRPQSPTRLENLIVSPLAWLLGELNALPAYWTSEILNVRLQGLVAHRVFELLFAPGVTTPSDAEITKRLPELYDLAIAEIAPFLQAESLTMERDNLRSDILKSAIGWAESLKILGASTIGAEFAPSGQIFDIPIRGKVDCLIQLADGRLIIVDHKKVGTSKRKSRLNAGWDLQVELYRRMLIGEPDPQHPMPKNIIAALEAAGCSAAIAYHLMNDGGVLINGVSDLAPNPPIQPVHGDISVNALERLENITEQLKRGEISLNKQTDEKKIKSESFLGPYALDSSPLVRHFMIADGVVDDSQGNDDD
jgi:hypothetical protein